MSRGTVIFVCTGNTCRSPMAEGLAKKTALECDCDILVFSRGIAVLKGSTVSEKSIKAMEVLGIGIADIVPTQLTESDVASADLILTMTASHKMLITSRFYEYGGKVFSISEYVSGKSADVSDPYGMPLTSYVQCAKQLSELVAAAVNKFTSEYEKG